MVHRVLLASTVVLAACGESPHRSSEAQEPPNLDPEIIHSSEPAWPEGRSWHVLEKPIVDIGGLNADRNHQLFQVRSAVRLSDGRIVVVNAGSHEIRFFSPSGEFLFGVGRDGEGPGEFREPYDLARFAGDSLLIRDLKNQRVSIFDANGQFVRSYQLPMPPFVALIGALFDGRLVVAANSIRYVGPAARTRSEQPLTYLLYSREGTLLDTLGHYPPEAKYAFRYRNAHVTLPLPFGRSTRAAVLGDRFYAGHNDVYEIHAYDSRGTLIRLIRRESDPLEVTGADIDALRDSLAGEDDSLMPGVVNEARRQAVDHLLQDITFPRTMPAFDDFRIDDLGFLWVAEYRRPSDKQRVWAVFDPGGTFLGKVATPPETDIRQIGHDFLLGIQRDDLGLEHVTVYRLIRG